ncbi:MAG: cytochrome b N-terminal domain-containing protein [Pseudomonadota bacterium]
MHIFPGLYFGSYEHPRKLLWILGAIIYVMMMATALLGYTLPYGQMSYWGAIVITNLFSAMPFVEGSLVVSILGGYNVGDATANRFYVLHSLIAFGIAAVVVWHIAA